MFLNNKYTRWYYEIINRAKTRNLTAYKESHHIIPKCMGGSDKLENRVDLTAREHALCHWLLTKMVDGENRGKMFYALRAFIMKSPVQNRLMKVPTKVIAEAREQSRQYSKKIQLGRKRSPESIERQRQTMTGRKRNPEFAKKVSQTLTGRKHSDTHKLNNARARLGKKLSEETKEKLKEAWKRRKIT